MRSMQFFRGISMLTFFERSVYGYSCIESGDEAYLNMLGVLLVLMHNRVTLWILVVSVLERWIDKNPRLETPQISVQTVLAATTYYDGTLHQYNAINLLR